MCDMMMMTANIKCQEESVQPEPEEECPESLLNVLKALHLNKHVRL